MSDMERVIEHVQNLGEGEEMSDAAARTLASQYHAGQWSESYAFASSGAIPDDGGAHLWREMFDNLHDRARMSPGAQRAADYLGTYLVRHGPRGPVASWSNLWLG